MKSINYNAPVTSKKTILINTGKEEVWSVLTNIPNWTTWQTHITNAKLNGPLKAKATFVWKTGGVKIHSTLHTVVPFKNFGWTGKTFGLFAIHNWTLTENDGQTRVTVEESMEGFFATLFKKKLNIDLDNKIQVWLDLLKQECEH